MNESTNGMAAGGMTAPMGVANPAVAPSGGIGKQKKKWPVWIWIVLGVLALALVGGVIWLIVGRGGTAETLTLESEVPANDDERSEAVKNYVNQLRSIARNDNSDSADGSDTSTLSGKASAEGVKEAQKSVSNALKTDAGSQQENVIKMAEAIFLFREQYYEQAIESTLKIDPESLGLEEQCSYYTILYTSYSALGDYAMAAEYLTILQQKTWELQVEKGING